MAATIINGAAVMTPDGLKRDWGVKVEGNRITQVGPNSTLTAGPGDTVVDATTRMVAPGFVNGHMHMYGSLSHGITTDALVTNFSNFLDDFWWPYVENRVDRPLAALTARWAAVEMIRSGITSFTDIVEAPNAIPGVLEAEAAEIEKAGLRAFLSFEACQRMSEENAQLGLKENADFVKNHNKDGALVQGMMCVHTLFTGDKAYMKQAKAMAKELGCDIHMHMSESVFEPTWTMEHYGQTPVDAYDEIGFLDDKTFISQVVQVSDPELDTLAARGARAVSMPISNCEVGGGIAPISAMIDKGMKVGLGTDGYVNNFFEVMRAAFLIHKAYQQSTEVMPANLVYRMATSLGADAMGLPDAGRLQEGCLADIITIELDTPTPINESNVYDQLVLFRNPENVNDTMVNGNFVMRDKRLLTIDEEATKAQLREAAAKFWTKD